MHMHMHMHARARAYTLTRDTCFVSRDTCDRVEYLQRTYSAPYNASAPYKQRTHNAPMPHLKRTTRANTQHHARKQTEARAQIHSTYGESFFILVQNAGVCVT